MGTYKRRACGVGSNGGVGVLGWEHISGRVSGVEREFLHVAAD